MMCLVIYSQVGAGGMVPLDERTESYLEETLSRLKGLGITHILCLAEGLCIFPDEFEYLQLRIADRCTEEENSLMMTYFPDAFNFIESALSTRGKVFVHCNAGMSRSPTIVVSYLMKKNKWTYEQAVRHVRSIRKCATTHAFESSLLSLEKLLSLET